MEPKRFDANIAKAEARAVKRAEASKKRKGAADAGEESPAKRAAITAPGEPNRPVSTPVSVPPPPPALAVANGIAEPEHAALATPGDALVDSTSSLPFDSSPPSNNLPASPETPTIPDSASGMDPPADPAGSDVICEDYKLDRRAVYDAVASPTPQWKKQTKKKGADRIEPALDDFINAATRQPGVPCVRLPVTIYFGNDNTSAYLFFFFKTLFVDLIYRF